MQAAASRNAVASAAKEPEAAAARRPQLEHARHRSSELKAFLVVGVTFSAHIIAGLLSIPIWIYLLCNLNRAAVALALLYLPFYLAPAHHWYPGWKGFDAFWRLADYTRTAPTYFRQFAVHGTVADAERQLVVGIHPHGALVFQRMFWRSELIPLKRPWRMIGASVLFRIPIIREMSLWFGAVDASKPMCRRLLRAGANLVLYPGGLDEANRPTTEPRVFVKVRTGFIRLAVEHGVAVLPVFTFGELEAIRSVPSLPPAAAEFLRKWFRISTNLFVGRWGLPIPHRTPMNMCLGQPVEVRAENEVDAEVSRVHAEYCRQLRTLYETNQDRFGYAGRELVIQT